MPISEVRLCDCMYLMRELQDKSIDLAICDPPYGIGINVNMGRRKGDKKSDYHKFEGGDKSIPSKEYFEQLFRVSKNQIVFGGNYMTQYLPPSPCWLLWDKGFSEDVTFAQFELAWTSFSSSCKKCDFNAAANTDRIHPTQKPTYLYKWILDKYAKQGDKIFDSHMGSQSSRIAAYDMGFDYFGCELDKDYFEAGNKRFELFKSQMKLF